MTDEQRKCCDSIDWATLLSYVLALLAAWFPKNPAPAPAPTPAPNPAAKPAAPK